MTRYFFHIFNDEQTVDEEGMELSDDDAARAVARREIQVQAAESVKLYAHLILSHKLVIVDASGREIDTMTFGDIVTVKQ